MRAREQRRGYAPLAGLLALVIAVSGALYAGFGGLLGGLGTDTTARPGGRGSAAPVSSGQWIGTWAAAPASAESADDGPAGRAADGHPDTSIRNVVRSTVGGSAARVRLSNVFGTEPLTVTHASLALAAAPSAPAAAPGTLRRLTFGTHRSVTIPPGRHVTSDPVRLRVPAATDLLVTVYSPTPSGPATHHPFARQTSYLAPGDHADDVTGTPYTETTPYWRHVTGVDVWSTEATGAVVALGDSLTDGISSSVGANRRWTDFLAARLRTESGAPHYSVLNAGISGNRVLRDAPAGRPTNGPSALSRLERDVLSRSGVRTLVIQLGLNDLGKRPRQTDAGKLVAGLEELARRAQARGVRVVGTTITPFAGHPAHTPRLEDVRQRANAAIRASEVFDAVADFDAALRDPARPHRLLPVYDSGDHIHPNDNGYRAMARAVDLRSLAAPTPATDL
ncbi:SGNH/GDSL hydrolase family protein [Streptomyces sp. TRM70308]|uniref:SGNH/GDSL hydrolase family protein n=1 Tax=Streptomyces sp. TRM70308 TaxID=3131932 RepID=UPI003CFFECDC